MTSPTRYCLALTALTLTSFANLAHAQCANGRCTPPAVTRQAPAQPTAPTCAAPITYVPGQPLRNLARAQPVRRTVRFFRNVRPVRRLIAAPFRLLFCE